MIKFEKPKHEKSILKDAIEKKKHTKRRRTQIKISKE
jgi:hypothetical protein